MAKWFEEVRLGSRPLEEIGAAFYVREILGNNCLVNKWDLRAVFGAGCADMLERLRRDGILVVESVGSQLRLSIVAPGDKKRRRCKELVQINRAVSKFEKGITRGRARESGHGGRDSGQGAERPTGMQEVSFV